MISQVTDIWILLGNVVIVIVMSVFILLMVTLVKNKSMSETYGNIIYLTLFSSVLLFVVEVSESIFHLSNMFGYVLSYDILYFVDMVILFVFLTSSFFIVDEWFNKMDGRYRNILYSSVMICTASVVLNTIVHMYDAPSVWPSYVVPALFLMIFGSQGLLSMMCMSKSRETTKKILSWRLMFLSLSSMFYTAWLSFIYISPLIDSVGMLYILSYMSMILLFMASIFQWLGWTTPTMVKKYIKRRYENDRWQY